MRRPLRTTVTALVTASFLGILEVLRTTLTRVLEGHVVVIHDLHRVVVTWFTLALASPWCAFMASRFPFRRGHTARALFAHLGGGAVFVALHMTLNVVLHTLATGERGPGLGPRLVHLYFFYIAMELSVYAAIVLVLLLLEARRESADRSIAAARLERSVTEARLESLRAQLQPHFLFNTLNALAVLARKGDGAAVDHAIGDLGELLRASFESAGAGEIPLGRELELVERYLHLQRIRFPDRLDVDWRVADDARRALVPTLLVQPLVENALEHGLSRTRGGRIVIAAHRDGQSLALEVADDGPGFAATAGKADGGDAGGGVGLANTRERLALLYGGRAALECGDGPAGGGAVRIRIPWHAEAEAGA